MKKRLTYNSYLGGTKQVLETSRVEKEKYFVEILGKKFIVHPNVFSPKYFHDTEFFAANLPVHKHDCVLEIGRGTGVISIEAAYKGACRVIAIDINPTAVKNTQENVALHHLGKIIAVRKGDLFKALSTDEKFDVIFWNTPFGLIENDTKISDLEKAVFDPGYDATERFIKQAHRYLTGDGNIFIGFSSALGRLDLVKKFVQEANLSIKLIAETKSRETHPVRFELYKLERCWKPTQAEAVYQPL